MDPVIIDEIMPDMPRATATNPLNGVNGVTVNGVVGPPRPPATAPSRAKVVKPGSPTKAHRRRFENFLTMTVAAVAVGGSATGMWAYFGDKLHITNLWERGALFSAFELAMLACGWRERKSRLRAAERAAEREALLRAGKDAGDPPRRGLPIDGLAVWAAATITGLLAASNETSWPGRFGRVFLPYLAAFMVERAIAAEASDLAPRRPRINWRFGPERLFVMLGLATAETVDVADVERTRHIGRLATLRFKADKGVFKTRARRRYDRALAKANERFGLASNPKLVAQLEAAIALLYTGFDSTAPDTIAFASPWGSGRIARAVARQTNSSEGQKSGHPAKTTRVTRTTSRAPDHDGPGRRPALENLVRFVEVAEANPGLNETAVLALMQLTGQRWRVIKRDLGLNGRKPTREDLSRLTSP